MDAIHEQIVCPCSAGHPRNDHQLIFPLRDDRLMLVWCEYYITRPSLILPRDPATGGTRDAAPCRISAKVSDDRGRSWSDTFTLQDNTGRDNVKHPCLVRLPDGEVLLFFTEWNALDDRRILMRRSSDDCETWGESERISSLDGFHCLNNDHALRLSTGRVVVPTHRGEFYGKGDHFQAFCYFSDDNGETWRHSGTRMDLPKRGAEEPSIVELGDGSLLAVMRTSLGAVYRSRSTDRGENWSEPESTGLEAPASPPLLKRIPSMGDLLLVWNHNVDPDHHHQGERNPLSSAISKDGGETWGHIRNIEDREGWGCAYAAVTFVGDEALVTYYHGSLVEQTSSVKLKILPIEWFYQ
ncbi:MAG: sialidase family protein [Candidatus Latescibacteria bacterium]|jgi:sialidase-1|nr:sialidase family protein [Candidatus Latescibacterota bacterium]